MGDHVVQRQRGLAEKVGAALVLQHQQLALDRGDRLHRDIAVAERDLLAAFADEVEHGLEVLEIQQQHPLLVRDAEGDVQHPLLRLRQVKHTGEQ